MKRGSIGRNIFVYLLLLIIFIGVLMTVTGSDNPVIQKMIGLVKSDSKAVLEIQGVGNDISAAFEKFVTNGGKINDLLGALKEGGLMDEFVQGLAKDYDKIKQIYEKNKDKEKGMNGYDAYKEFIGELLKSRGFESFDFQDYVGTIDYLEKDGKESLIFKGKENLRDGISLEINDESKGMSLKATDNGILLSKGGMSLEILQGGKDVKVEGFKVSGIKNTNLDNSESFDVEALKGEVSIGKSGELTVGKKDSELNVLKGKEAFSFASRNNGEIGSVEVMPKGYQGKNVVVSSSENGKKIYGATFGGKDASYIGTEKLQDFKGNQLILKKGGTSEVYLSKGSSGVIKFNPTSDSGYKLAELKPENSAGTITKAQEYSNIDKTGLLISNEGAFDNRASGKADAKVLGEGRVNNGPDLPATDSVKDNKPDDNNKPDDQKPGDNTNDGGPTGGGGGGGGGSSAGADDKMMQFIEKLMAALKELAAAFQQQEQPQDDSGPDGNPDGNPVPGDLTASNAEGCICDSSGCSQCPDGDCSECGHEVFDWSGNSNDNSEEPDIVSAI